MSTPFKVGDRVAWRSDVGEVHGRVTKVHHQDVVFLGKLRRASRAAPQYEVESANTGAGAMHHAGAMRKLT